MTAHAKLSASGAATWINCPAAPRISADLPNDSSSFAEEGTRAHEQAEAMLRGAAQPHPEMAEEVRQYVDLVTELAAGTTPLIEQRLEYTEWVPEGFGTADAVIIHDGTLTIVDLKYGKGIKVDAANNPQLRLYALAACQRWQWEHDINAIKMVICQPRLDHISEESMPVIDLLRWGEWVKERVALVEHPESPAVPGAKQCQWCRAKAICRARAVHSLTVAGSDHLTPADISALMPLLDGVAQWVTDVKAHALSTLASGDDLPGYKLVEGRSVRTLTDNAVDILRSAGLDDSAIYRQSYRTLSDIEKALGGKKNAAPVLEQCTTKPAGKPTIVPTSDPRPSIQPATVANFEIGE